MPWWVWRPPDRERRVHERFRAVKRVPELLKSKLQGHLAHYLNSDKQMVLYPSHSSSTTFEGSRYINVIIIALIILFAPIALSYSALWLRNSLLLSIILFKTWWPTLLGVSMVSYLDPTQSRTHPALEPRRDNSS